VNCFNGNDGMATATVTGGSGIYSYSWSNGSVYPTVTDLTIGNYTLTVTDSRGCIEQSSAIINEPSELVSSSTSTAVHCFGGSDGSAIVTVNGGVAPYDYDWSPYGGNANIANNLSTGDYSVSIHDAHGCPHQILVSVNSPAQIILSTSGDSTHCYHGNEGAAQVAVLGGIAPYSYFWDNGDTTISATQLYAGTYTVAVSDSNGCIAQESVVINEPTQVRASVITPPIVCIGQPALLQASATGGTPSYSYSWNNGIDSIQQNVSPNLTTIYTVIARDAFGCISPSQQVTVTVQPPLIATVATPDTVCEGSSVVLMGFGNGGNGGPYHYSWSNGGTGSTITVAPTITTTYFITATDECGTPPATALVHVAVSPTPLVNFTQDSYAGCQALTVSFKDSTDMPGREYYWSFGDGESDITENPTHVYTEPGNYTVNHLVLSEMGCSGRMTKSAIVKVYQMPIADFTCDPETTSVLLPAITFFENCSNTVKWEWNFGDKTGTFIQKEITHAYSDTGSYRIRLITTSDKGCKDTTYREILIKNEFGFYIPNAFSPNNDAVNDVFTPLGLGLKSYEMLIYDRWGELIFSTTDISKGWDGSTLNGEKPSQTDVYVYVIRVMDLQNKSHDYTGHVSLVR
jgi:gliding motility-associated-like protein